MALALAVPVATTAAPGPEDAPKGASSAPWLDLPGLAAGCNGGIRALAALADGRIALGGTFTRCGSTDVARVALFDPASGAFEALAGGVSADGAPVVPGVSALLARGEFLYAGGAFARAGGVAVRNLARFDLSTGAWSPLGAAGAEGVDGEVLALAGASDELYVGGAFARAGGQPSANLARFTIGSQSWSSLPAAPAGAVRALAVDGGALYAGGDFQRIGSAAIAHLGRFDLAASTWGALGAGVDGSVRALAVADGTLYAGGALRQAGGSPAHLVAAWDGAAWRTLGTDAEEGLRGGPLYLRTVDALAVAEGELLATGAHLRAGTRAASRIARFDRRAQAWSALGSASAEGLDAGGQAIVVSAGVAYVGGAFRRAGGSARGGLAALVMPDALFRDGYEPQP